MWASGLSDCRVRSSTQDVDELVRPHFVYGAWLYFDLRVDKGAYKNSMPMQITS